MNICVLTHSFPRNKKDTAAAFMKEFSDGLVEAGNKVFVLTPYDREFNRRGDKFNLVTYKYIWPETWHKLGYSRAMKADVSLKFFNFLLLPFLLFFGTLALFRLVRKEKIEIVNVHWILPNGAIAFLVSLATGIPYVITLPGTDAYLASKNKIFGFAAKYIAKAAKGIISNSSWHLRRIMNLGVGENPTAIIPYPVDPFFVKPSPKGAFALREKLGLTNKDLILMAIGRLVYKKGFSYLIKAMPEVLRKNPRTKLIIGGDGDLRTRLEKLAEGLRLQKVVKFVGNIQRDEILNFYNLADVFIAPSVVDKRGNVDGGPVVSYESMACGKPQIATNVLGVADIIKDGTNGYVVKQKSTGQLAAAINRLLRSKKLREKMGRANRKLIRRGLTTKSIGIAYNEFFEKIRN